MKLRSREPLERNLSPEQKTQIELARIEVAREKAKHQMDSGVQHSITWSICIALVLISLIISLTVYNNNANAIKSKEKIAIEELDNEKILNGYQKQQMINEVMFRNEWTKSK